jgi:hypothetical protein
MPKQINGINNQPAEQSQPGAHLLVKSLKRRLPIAQQLGKLG